TGSNPVVCTALDQCHVAGTCNTATGLCSNPNASNGTACNDGNACTPTDPCPRLKSPGSNAGRRTPSDQSHAAGTCHTATGPCPTPNACNGTACPAADACTHSLPDAIPICTGSNPVVCTAPDQCHVAGTCNTATGQCSSPNASNGTACNDGNAC